MKKKLVLAIAIIAVIGVAAFMLLQPKNSLPVAGDEPINSAPQTSSEPIEDTDDTESLPPDDTVVPPVKSTTPVIIQEERPEAPFEKSEVNEDGKEVLIIASGPDKGKELILPSDEEWRALTPQEQKAYHDALDPEGAAYAIQPGETREEWRARTDKPNEEALARSKEAWGF